MAMTNCQSSFVIASIVVFIALTLVMLIPHWVQYTTHKEIYHKDHNITVSWSPLYYHTTRRNEGKPRSEHHGFLDFNNFNFQEWVTASTVMSVSAVLLLMLSITLDVLSVCQCRCLRYSNFPWKIMTQSLSTLLTGLLCLIVLILVARRGDDFTYDNQKGVARKGWPIFVFILPLLGVFVLGAFHTFDFYLTWKSRATLDYFKCGQPVAMDQSQEERLLLQRD